MQQNFEFKHDEVRDLAWVMNSPGLLTEFGNNMTMPIVSDVDCNNLYQQHHAWLLQQNNDPSELKQWLKLRESHRLGYYFESLIEYWLQHVTINGFLQFPACKGTDRA